MPEQIRSDDTQRIDDQANETRDGEGEGGGSSGNRFAREDLGQVRRHDGKPWDQQQDEE
jgi:hypothetical protein